MRDLVRLVSMSRGADFEINLAAFSEPEPLFAYVDDVRAGVQVLQGLVEAGSMTIYGQQPFIWLTGDRDCILLRATATGKREGTAAFRSLSVGEFCFEIYYVPTDHSVQLLHQDVFSFT